MLTFLLSCGICYGDIKSLKIFWRHSLSPSQLSEPTCMLHYTIPSTNHSIT